jgi:hypothetical protein
MSEQITVVRKVTPTPIESIEVISKYGKLLVIEPSKNKSGVYLRIAHNEGFLITKEDFKNLTPALQELSDQINK